MDLSAVWKWNNFEAPIAFAEPQSLIAVTTCLLNSEINDVIGEDLIFIHLKIYFEGRVF